MAEAVVGEGSEANHPLGKSAYNTGLINRELSYIGSSSANLAT